MIDQIKSLLDKATRPVLYAGHGCTLHRVRFERFVDDLGIQIMLSWRAIDLLPDNHPLFAGRPGLIAQPEANKRIMSADLVLILGARVDDSMTCFDIAGFAPKARKIVVDIDRAELDRLPEDWLKLNQDVGEFMKELDEVME
jgi:acetolactate synthase-1/2/3 large subunit